ncbi:hypothetical protein ACH5RR_032052 [Cinchona calisaya]|uniref:Disease resistance N-terminal domain-containing protein n=1 Tax=Cinchona calisaya TaxID=153742 RepID=A0ABD2YKF2_9GENT
MQCFLRDADTRENTDETIRNWLKEIRALTYRAEDIVETFSVEVASKRGKGVKKVLKRLTCLICEGRSLYNIGTVIAKVKTDINNLTASLRSYNIKRISEGESESESSSSGTKI